MKYHRVSASDEDGDHNDDHTTAGAEAFSRRHTCTDVPCCLIFLVSLVAFGYLYASSLKEGNIKKLFHGIDSNNNICGVDSSVEEKPYLYWCKNPVNDVANVAGVAGGDISSIKLGESVCVAKCPSGGDAVPPACSSNNTSGSSLSDQAYATTTFLERYCIPGDKNMQRAALNITSEYLDSGDMTFTEGLSSIPTGWPIILATFGLAVVLGYVHLSLLRCCAELLLWVTIAVSIACLAAAGCFLWVNAGTLSNHIPEGIDVPSGADATENETKATKAIAVIFWALAAAALCLACCMRHSIDAAAGAIQVACSAIFEMPSLLLAPVFKALAKVTLFGVLLYGFLMLYSTGEVTGAGDGLIRHFSHTHHQNLVMVLYMLMSFWILAFINALYQFMVAYAVCHYYYEPHDEDGDKIVDGCCSAWEGVHVGLSFHAGSLAFGSFLMAFLHTLQKVIEYAELKNKEAGNNKVVSCVLCLCDCCVKCFKDIIGFINKNAYIDMAITSSSFCTSARHALAMIVELAGAMAILNGATYVFAVFGSALITLVSGACALLACRMGPFAEEGNKYHIDAPLPVAAVSMCVAFLVSVCFMHVFDMASDTLLYCYGVDLHNGTGGHTAPQELKDLVDQHGNDEDHHADN